ncbi:MAG: hypothetical protein AAGE52_34560 [Myxococcota bacterium]
MIVDALARTPSFLRETIRSAHELGGYRERDVARARVREKQPRSVRALRTQWHGVGTAGCAATHSVHEACDFGCTACYLGREANRTVPASFATVAGQLDAIRAALGPAGNVQITSGEVTLLPREDLARIVRYAKGIGLDPMVMSHGQTFLRDPSYLEFLVRAGLEKVGLHVDVTQRGRPGHSRPQRERELHEVRDRLAQAVRRVRRRTGRPLAAAHTVTVTEANQGDIGEVVRWTLRNSDVFRMLSFQPTAEVGRTRERETGGATVWNSVTREVGRPLSPHTFTMGHPACNRLCLAFVVRFGERVEVLEVAREGAPVDARFLDRLGAGAFRHFYLDGATRAEAVGRVLGVLARSPEYAFSFPLYALYRLVGEVAWLPQFLRAAARGDASVRPFVFVVHDFMSARELETDEGRERLAACVFRVPVEGRMVSMCKLNGSGLRDALYGDLVPAEQLRR